MFMKKTNGNRRGYERPATVILELRPEQVLAASTGGFDDGGELPGWGGGSGAGTSDFGNGGTLPGWN